MIKCSCCTNRLKLMGSGDMKKHVIDIEIEFDADDMLIALATLWKKHNQRGTRAVSLTLSDAEELVDNLSILIKKAKEEERKGDTLHRLARVYARAYYLARTVGSSEGLDEFAGARNEDERNFAKDGYEAGISDYANEDL